MVTSAQTTEFIERLLQTGEGIDPADLTIFYAWLYSAYYALEPIPDLHQQFREHCLDASDPARTRFKIGLFLLRSALTKAKAGYTIPEGALSPEYMSLLETAFR